MPIRQLRLPVLAVALILWLALAACSTEDSIPAQSPTSAPTVAPSATSAPPAASGVQLSPTPAVAPEATIMPAPTAAPPVAATATPAPDPRLAALAGVQGIVDPTNLGWPREVEGLNGRISILARPERIITASVGHDEMVLAIVPTDRLVAVGGATKSETFSNVAFLVQDKAEITRDPETIIAQSPDVIVTSPFFSADGIDALTRVGIPVVQTALSHDPEVRIDSILLVGYILGEVERAIEFADEVRSRYDATVSVTSAQSTRPRALSLARYSDKLWVAGNNSTEGAIIEAAGGVNAAAEAGIESNQITSLEGVIAMNPDIIIIPQPVEFGAEDVRRDLLENEALAEIPAIKNGNVYVVDGKYFTTLSHWNIRGVEDLAAILWPDTFADMQADSFSLPE